jgi:predicted component of type VI protein secretion system
LERLSSVHRRAHLWELYADQYNSLREESWDNFERCFVEALREGYETEVRSHDTAFDPPGAGRGGAAK